MLMKSAGQVICMANKFKFDAIALTDDNFQISIIYVMVNVKQYLSEKIFLLRINMILRRRKPK